jgi:hypothetical protein
MDTGVGTAAEPGTLEELRAEFPDWIIDKGISGLYYARRPQDSPILSGEDLLGMRDQILGWIRRHDHQADTTVGRVRTLPCTWCQAPAAAACDQERDADHLIRYTRARHAALISPDEHARAVPDASPDGGSPMVTAARHG